MCKFVTNSTCCVCKRYVCRMVTVHINGTGYSINSTGVNL